MGKDGYRTGSSRVSQYSLTPSYPDAVWDPTVRVPALRGEINIFVILEYLEVLNLVKQLRRPRGRYF